MATKIVTKNSSTASAVPTASDLVQGELAVNVVDKRLFTENNAGAIVELGTNPSTIDINAGTIDGAVIGGTTPAAITGSTVTSTGNIVVTGTVDGRDVATDGTKLDGIEAGADVTDTTNVTAAGALMDSEVTNLAQVKAFDSADYATAAQGTKVDGIEAGADVTDTANVTAAGALMDSELTSIASVKALDQGVATADSPAFAGLTVDTTTLAVDSTNNRVGIGTTSPDQALTVSGNIQIQNDDGYLQFKDTNGGTNNKFRRIYNQEQNLYISRRNDDESLQSNDVVIDSSGNVGIFTTSPDEKLEVNGDAKISGADSGNAGVLHFGGVSDDVKIAGFDRNSGTANSMLFYTNTAERMRIDSTGKVGIGTNSPSTYGGKLNITDGVVGGESTLVIANNNANQFVRVGINNNIAQIAYDNADTLAFGEATDSTTSGLTTERMRIDSSGNVAIGTTAPQARLHISRPTDGSEASPHLRIDGAASTYVASHWLDSNAYYIGQGSTFRSLRIYSGAETSGVHLASGGTSWGTFSDERLKYDVEPVENAVESLSNLRTVKYRLKDVDSSEDKKKLGLMAQDLVGILDEVIDPVKRTGDETEYMSVKYTELVPVLVKAIQEQQTLIESLTARIAALEA